MDERAAPVEQRFGALPERVPPESWVETVDVGTHPVGTEESEQARLLRLAGGGAPV